MLPRIFITLLALALGGCISQHQSVMTQTPISGWCSPIELTLPNLDTTTVRDIALVVRYRPSWVSENIEVAIETIAPDSVSVVDTIRLSFEKYSSPRGGARIESIGYRRAAVWRQEGGYQVNIKPVDGRCINGVESVGINITPNEDIKGSLNFSPNDL